MVGLAMACVAAVPAAQVLASQYDNARTGATLSERTLTPANVNAGQFGKVFSFVVDGDVYAQPLFLPRLSIPGKGVHNVVFIATEHDSLYAFDADGRPAEPLWKVSLLSGPGVTPVSAGAVSCPFISPEIGITPTPVIDYPFGTLYVLARTKERLGFLKGSRYVQRLRALAVTTGVEKLGGPVEIAARDAGAARCGRDGPGGRQDRRSLHPDAEAPHAGAGLGVRRGRPGSRAPSARPPDSNRSSSRLPQS
jgi:hypothetical protein